MKRVIVDDRRQVFVAKTEDEAYEFMAQTFIEEAKKSIAARASFSVALSGGNTPLRLYELLTEPSSALTVNWSLLDLFWGDERSVSADHSESNYGQASHYFSAAPLDQAKRHRIVADCENLDMSAEEYEKAMKKACSNGRYDMVLLGIGDDGHTASLFPHTKALSETERLYVANEVPQKGTWRITMTYPAINQARSTYVLAFGRSKAKMLKKIFFGEPNIDECPAQYIGVASAPACYIIDKKAAYGLGL
ncbi:MAG: 6-phosphogluconolactonase [Chlamydia sp.]